MAPFRTVIECAGGEQPKFYQGAWRGACPLVKLANGMLFWKTAKSGQVPGTAATHPSQQAVTPRECALAVGIPLSCDEYLSDLQRADKDLAHRIKRKAQKDSGSTTLSD